VATFYRGGWCPYCNVQLRAYQQVLGEITRLGAKLVAISPELPNGSMSTAEVNRLSFDVLGDIGNRVARSFGLVCSLPQELRAALRYNDKTLPSNCLLQRRVTNEVSS
jgi:peroxiredoxin